jgi:hypothetical protein
MKRVARLSAPQRQELFAQTAKKRGIGSASIIEKDFWVCWVLKQIFSHPELKDKLLFKGGTSLSKVFGLIDRFSEDIDLILDWQLVTDQNPMEKRSNTQQAKLNAKINEKAKAYISSALLELLEEALGSHCTAELGTEEEDQGHVVNIHYPETGERGYLRPCIRLEIGPLASWLPHSEYVIHPYAAEEFPSQFKEMECPVRAIDAKRTFWEKATILHHEAHRPQTSTVPSRYSRHCYDLFLMAETDVRQEALEDLSLLREVVEFKTRFYPRGWARYDLAKPGSLKLVPPKRILSEIQKDYESMQEMIFGRHPSFEEIIKGLSLLEKEINGG